MLGRRMTNERGDRVHRLRHRMGVVWGIVAILVATAVPAFGAGISAVPGTIEIDDALRGSTIFRDVMLYNNTEEVVPFEISFVDEAAPWMSAVDPEDRTTPVTEALDPDGSGVPLVIRIDIPSDIENGTYQGTLAARIAPPEEGAEGGGATVGLGLLIPFTIEVGGDQVIAASLLDLSIRSTEIGVPARAVALIENTGNTQITPELTLEVLQGDSTVTKITTANATSYPGEQGTFEVVWDTTNAQPGEYTARISIDFGGIDLGTETLEFSVHPAGALTRSVAFTSLKPAGEARAGGLAGFTAVVTNPGQVDVSATIVGDLTKNGSVVGTYESPPFLVKAGEDISIPVNVEVPDEGDFEFTAHVVYGNGETTDSLSVSFSTVDPLDTLASVTGEGSDDAGGVPTTALIAGGVLLLVLIGAGVWAMTRKRGGGDRSTDASGGDVDPDKEAATVGSGE